MKKKTLVIICIGLAILFFLTNPSVKDFKEHLGKVSYSGLFRRNNFLFWSIYVDNTSENQFSSKAKYVAIFDNFIKTTPTPINNINERVDSVKFDDQRTSDSVKKAWQPPTTDTIVLPKGATLLERKISIPEFAKRIKLKYPEYRKINDTTLTLLILKKYPVYINSVEL